jgi:hypothetical protein
MNERPEHMIEREQHRKEEKIPVKQETPADNEIIEKLDKMQQENEGLAMMIKELKSQLNQMKRMRKNDH